MFTEAIFTIVLSWKQPKCLSTDEQTNKTWSTHTLEYCSIIKRNEVLIHRFTMDELQNHYAKGKKQKHYFAAKGLYSQNYGFSSSHIQM